MARAQTEFLVVGQGLAGSLVAFLLQKAGRQVRVVDEGKPHTASRATLGLMNPVTGRKMKLAWNIGEVFPRAEQTYRELERELGISIYRPIPIVRFFIDEKQKRIWEKKASEPEFRPYVIGPAGEELLERVHAPLGGVVFSGGAVVNVPLLLDRFRERLRKEGILIEQRIAYDQLVFEPQAVNCGDWRAETVIFCEGWRGRENPFLQHLPWTPVKGESLTVEIPEFPDSHVLHRGLFVRPLGASRFRVGATHEHEDLSEKVTESGRAQLETRLADFIKKPFRVLEAHAGVRPTVQGTMPVVGRHPQQPRLAVLNGLGSKGVSRAAFCALALVEHLLHDRPIQPEISLLRFF